MNKLKSALTLILASIAAVTLTFLILWLSFIGQKYPPMTPKPTLHDAVMIHTSTTEPNFTATSEPSYTPTAETSTPLGNDPPVTPTPGPLILTPDILPTFWLEYFEVGPWHDDSVFCDKNPSHRWVRIKGVRISGGPPPYKIIFEQSGQTIALKQVDINGEVEFIEPIVVTKGTPVTVTILFESGMGPWKQKLYYYYLDDPRCSK